MAPDERRSNRPNQAANHETHENGFCQFRVVCVFRGGKQNTHDSAAIARRRIFFLPETLVSTPQGDRAIGDLESGDLVHAYDFEAGQWVAREVEARHDNISDGKIYQILIGDERIGATPKHPFWVVEGASLGDRSIPPELKAGENEGQKLSGRWVRADEMQVGDLVYQRDGSHSAIQSIDIEEVEGQRVCNLTVKDLHNYAVGKLATLVHNGTGCERDVDVPKGGTYRLRDPDTNGVRRTGRSNDLARREGEHARDKATKDLDFEVDKRTDDYAQQRGREQIIHDQHSEALAANGGLNKQRPISPTNPNRQIYMDAAKKIE